MSYRDDPHGTRRPLVASAASVFVVLIALGAVALGTAIEQAAHPPTCYGIGWGCEPDPAATAALVGIIVGAPVLAVTLAATWIGWGLTRRRSERANRIASWLPAVLVGAGAFALAGAALVEVITTAG